MQYTVFGRLAVAVLLIALTPLTGEHYNYAGVRSHQFVETWSSLRGRRFTSGHM